MVETTNNPSLSDSAGKVRDGAVEFAGAAVDTAKEKMSEACSQTQEVIKENPYTSVLVAFGIGAILGVVLSRR